MLWRPQNPAELVDVGDDHLWYLFLAWLSLFDRTLVGPLVASGNLVVTDMWWPKYLARFSLKPLFPPRVLHLVKESFRKPELTIQLDLEPEIALARKHVLKPTECGHIEGFCGERSHSFVSYQQQVRERLLQGAAVAKVISADQSPRLVCHAALAAVLQCFGISRHLPWVEDEGRSGDLSSTTLYGQPPT